MTAPILDRKLTLEAAARVPDGAGGAALTWTALGELWAEIRPGSGGARAEEALTISRVRCRITVRAAPVGSPARPRPEQRFREGDRVFRILAVSERDDRGRYLTCFAEEEVVA